MTKRKRPNRHLEALQSIEKTIEEMPLSHAERQEALSRIRPFYTEKPKPPVHSFWGEQVQVTQEQWQMLEAHLSKPLDDNSKALILDFIDLIDTFNRLEKALPSLTNAELHEKLVHFKETAQSLIPKPLTPLSEQSKQKMIACYKALSFKDHDVKAHLSYPIFLMTRNTATEDLHPSQYYCAAIIAIDRLPTKKTPQNKKGAGRSEADNEQLYKRIWKLWRELGETDTGVTHTDANTSPLVAFTHELFQRVNIERGYSSIRQNLAKYKKV